MSDTTSRGTGRTLFYERREDDQSGHHHRLAVGLLGATLPPLVWLLDRLRPTPEILDGALTSISAYYFTGAVFVFVAAVAALSVYLLTYRGYGNEYRKADKITSLVAGSATALVVIFPTRPPEEVDAAWWSEWQGMVHVGSALVLFACFAVFAYFLFPKSDPKRPETDPEKKKEKRRKNIFFKLCGVGIGAAIVVTVAMYFKGYSIFWPETVALEIFAFSWLVKGHALYTAGSVAYFVRRPGEAKDRLWEWVATTA